MRNKTEKMIDMVEEFYRQIRDTEYLYKGKEMTSKDKVERLDAVCDMLYIRLGTFLESMTSKYDLKNLLDYRLDKKINMIMDL